MFRNTNHEENFLGAKTPPVSLTSHDAASLRQNSQGSSWVSMFSVVSRPALSLLQKVIPGRTRTPALSDCISFTSGEFKLNVTDAESVFLGQLDNIIPITQHSTQMAFLHCQHECASGLKPDYALTFNWLTVDSLRELGFENVTEMDLKIQPQTSVGYLETVRSLLGQVDSAQEMRRAETRQLSAGKTRMSAVTSPSKSVSNWWGEFWGNENKLQSWLSNLSWSKEATGTSSRHYVKSEMVTKAAFAKPTELFVQWNNVESMHVESSGPPRHKEEIPYNGNLQTTPPESHQSLQGLPLEPWPFTVISNQLANTGAATACTEVAVLTPDQDNGYSSLEEEHTTSRHNMVKMNGDSISLATVSVGEREGEAVEQGQQGKTAASGDMDKEEQERVNFSLSESDDEVEPLSPAGPHAYPTPTCQNRAIAYIMGSTCSDDSQSDDTLSEDEKDDDGFDSEGCSDSSDSDKEDDDQEDGSDSEDAEAERLWNSLCKNNDPYNLHNFTATIRSSSSPPAASSPRTIPPPTSSSATCPPHASPLNQPLSPSPLSPPASTPSLAALESWDESSASEIDDAESLYLWNSFTATSDPYSPLNFQAPLRTQVPCSGEGGQVRNSRSSTRHSQLSSPQDKTSKAEERQDGGFSETQGNILSATIITSHCCVALKKVRFCDQVEEFYSSPEDRRSPWEQLARDRCRFLRRVQEVEEAIGHVLVPASRLLAYQKLGL